MLIFRLFGRRIGTFFCHRKSFQESFLRDDFDAEFLRFFILAGGRFDVVVDKERGRAADTSCHATALAFDVVLKFFSLEMVGFLSEVTKVFSVLEMVGFARDDKGHSFQILGLVVVLFYYLNVIQ